MRSDLHRSVRLLQAYAVGLTAAVVALGIIGWRRGTPGTQRFDEIDVQRINVVEPDGTIRLVLSDKARFPGLYLKRKEYSHPRGTAGLLFFNDEGTEDGGLAYRGSHGDSGTVADGEIMFDRYGQDQTIGLEYSDVPTRRLAALEVWDRPDTISIEDMITRSQAISKMPEGPERTRARDALRAATGSMRLFAGRNQDHASTVVLSDPQGRPRLRLVVDEAGDGRIEFLDASGRVTSTLRPK
jgi:hypothetical protein